MRETETRRSVYKKAWCKGAVSSPLARDELRGDQRGTGERATGEVTREGEAVVLADHSTDGPCSMTAAEKVGK